MLYYAEHNIIEYHPRDRCAVNRFDTANGRAVCTYTRDGLSERAGENEGGSLLPPDAGSI